MDAIDQTNNIDLFIDNAHSPLSIPTKFINNLTSAKYYTSKLLNNHETQKYESTDFSFFWKNGDGSPLFMNASKYDPDHKLGYQSFVFCPMPKVGCSSWKQVFRRMKGISNYLADDYWSLHSNRNELEMDRIHRFNGIDGANEILYNPDIIHAVFVREPIERALSAWIDKCIQGHWEGKYWCMPTSSKDINQNIFSSFDLFVEAIINIPNRNQGIWGMDYHWLPQNFVCDLYKFSKRYMIYNMHNVTNRKQFLLDIGGEHLWNKIGKSGWLYHNSKNEAVEAPKRRRLHRRAPNIHRVKDRKKSRQILKRLKSRRKKKHLPTMLINTVLGKKAEPIPDAYIQGVKDGQKVEASASLIQENAFHRSDARFKIFKYFRADMVAKLIAFYEQDYILFGMHLPSWICSYIMNYHLLIEKIEKLIVGHYELLSIFNNTRVNRRNTKKVQKIWAVMQKEILYGNEGNEQEFEIESDSASLHHLNILSSAKYATFYPGHNRIQTEIELPADLQTHRPELWTRKYELYRKYSNATKILDFYSMLEFDEKYPFFILHQIRGLIVLSNVISLVDYKIWPVQMMDCFNSQMHFFDFSATIAEHETLMKKLLDLYFVQYLPLKLQLLQKFTKKNLEIFKELQGKLNSFGLDFYSNKRTGDELFDEWKNADTILYSNIKRNVRVLRDVPRQMARPVISMYN